MLLLSPKKGKEEHSIPTDCGCHMTYTEFFKALYTSVEAIDE